MGRPKNCIHVEPPGFHGEELTGKRGFGKTRLPGGDRGRKEGVMNKARLEWVMSGLKQYALTTGEDSFLKTVSADFDRTRALTAHQEERLENLYKEKSNLTPNKKSDQLSVINSVKKSRPRMPRGRIFKAKGPHAVVLERRG